MLKQRNHNKCTKTTKKTKTKKIYDNKTRIKIITTFCGTKKDNILKSFIQPFFVRAACSLLAYSEALRKSLYFFTPHFARALFSLFSVSIHTYKYI